MTKPLCLRTHVRNSSSTCTPGNSYNNLIWGASNGYVHVITIFFCWPITPFIISLPYDDPHPSCSKQFTYYRLLWLLGNCQKIYIHVHVRSSLTHIFKDNTLIPPPPPLTPPHTHTHPSPLDRYMYMHVYIHNVITHTHHFKPGVPLKAKGGFQCGRGFTGFITHSHTHRLAPCHSTITHRQA